VVAVVASVCTDLVYVTEKTTSPGSSDYFIDLLFFSRGYCSGIFWNLIYC